MQVCESTGVPVHPVGPDVTTVRVWLPPGWQAVQAEYVYWQDAGGGGAYVHAWETTGVPVHPAGVAEVTVRACVLLD